MAFKGSKKYHGPSRDKIGEETGDGSDLTVDEDTEVVFADTNDSALTITLPESAEVDGKKVKIVDVGGNAGTNAITITAASGNNVNGSNQDVTIGTNNGKKEAFWSGDEWFIY